MKSISENLWEKEQPPFSVITSVASPDQLIPATAATRAVMDLPDHFPKYCVLLMLRLALLLDLFFTVSILCN